MHKKFRLGNVAGLTVYGRGNALPGAVAVWLVFTILTFWFLDFSLREAVIAGLAVMLLHYASEFWHHYCHAWAARRTGYPMEGVLYLWVVAVSLYPRDEPELPAKIHIRRALGGPFGSLALALFAGIITWALRPFGGMMYWLAGFVFLDNMLIYTICALLPLGFTDGSTLLRWWGKRG